MNSLYKSNCFTEGLLQQRKNELQNANEICKRVKTSGFAKKNRVRLMEGIEDKFMKVASNNPTISQRKLKDKDFYNKKRLSKLQ